MAACTSNNNRFSSSSFIPHWNVFLSYRGEDTRKTFTGHLYTALKQAGIKTFIDDYGIPRGENISHQLRKAIRVSDIALVIFSKNYAFSPWCLNELVEILECKQKMGKLVYPVFYDVSPSVVRNKTESFRTAFEGHEKTYFSNMEKVDKWKAALTEAANLSGYDLQNDADGHEVRLVQIIVKKVLLDLKNLGRPKVAKEQVGRDSRCADKTAQLSSTGINDIRNVGLHILDKLSSKTWPEAMLMLQTRGGFREGPLVHGTLDLFM
ncbi:hypothetical protein AgCh_002799 [Apium graveolens]